jgi:hypothetical protein
MDLIIENKTQDLFQRTLEDLKVQLKFVGTFGFGITGLWELVNDLIHSRYPSLSEEQIVLIFLTALTYFSITVVDDVKKLRALIREKGLSNALGQTIETLKDFENIAIKVAEKSGYVVSSLAELAGYVFLLIPILDVVQMLVRQQEFDIITLGIYLKSLLASVGIFYTKNLFNRLISRLRGRKGKEDSDETVIKEHQENKDELRRILDKYEESWRTISPETIIELAMMDPSPDYRYLDWMAYQVHSGFWLGIEMKYISDLIQEFHYNRENLTRERLLMMVDKMREVYSKSNSLFVWNNEEIFNQILEDPTNINNYPGYAQVEQILGLANLPEKPERKKGGNSWNLHEDDSDYLQRKGDRLTRKVIQDILYILKTEEVLDDLYILPDYISGVDGDEYTSGELEFNVTLHILENPNQENTFLVDANMGGDFDDEIEIILTLSPEFGKEDYHNIQGLLNDYIRHEIEHIIDALEGGSIESPEGLSPYEYYTQPHEVRAQKAGFKRRAKIDKKPLKDIVKNYIEYRQRIDKLTDSEKESLISHLTEQEKKSRFRTIYENDNWKYVWPIGRQSYCEVAAGTQWCKQFGDKLWFEAMSQGTHYILIDKKSREKYNIVDSEKVPGMPGYDVRVYDKNTQFINTHRFLADKPTLQELFNQSYTMLDKLRYDVDVPEEELEKFYKTNSEKFEVHNKGVKGEENHFLDLVYKIIKNPNLDGIKGQLEEKYGEDFTILSPDDEPVINSIIAEKDHLSIYLMNDDFKSDWMNIGEDDDWYFDLATDRYYSEDHCEDLEEDEISYIGNYMDEGNIEKLNNIAELIGEKEEDWTDEGAVDEYMTKYFKKDWEDHLWRIVDQIGCAVGRNRVKDITEIIEEDKLLDFEYVGHGNYPLWRLDIKYPELLYLIGTYGVENIKELGDHHINELANVSLNDSWWDSWRIDDGEEDINLEIESFLDFIINKHSDNLKALGDNREKFEKTVNDLGFTKPYREWVLRQPIPPTLKNPKGLERTITIKDWDLVSGKVHIQIEGNDDQGRWQTKQYQTTIDELPTYVTQEQLFEIKKGT